MSEGTAVPKQAGSTLRLERRRETAAAWLFSTPALVLLFVFLILPFLFAFVFSFTDQRLISNPNLPTQFVGLRNFIRMFQDDVFYKALWNNFYFVLIVVPIQSALALGMALLVNLPLRFKNLFRTIYFTPVVTTMVVVAIVWSFLFNPEAGLINEFLNFLSGGRIGNIQWLKSTTAAMPAIMILSIWQGVGFQMIIFLAGLQDIPNELYEAAEVDGARGLRRFFSITLPQLKNTTIFVVLSTSILAFKLFTQVWVLTEGGPERATITMIVYLYRNGFRELRVGYSSAVAVVFFVIVLIFSLIQQYFIRDDEGVR